MKKIVIVALLLATVAAHGQKKDFIVTIETEYGDMVCVLFDQTPKHKANFIKLAQQHFYDSTLFHRVIPEFMIQGGDPDSRRAKPGQHLGLGGPGYTIEAELNPMLIHKRGVLAAARTADASNPSKASSGSQFYIVQGKKMTEAELTTDFRKLDEAMKQFFQNPANNAAFDSLLAVYKTRDDKAIEAALIRLKPRIEKQLGVNLSKNLTPAQLEAYTTIGGTPQLDGDYTVFGKVIVGLDVIDRIIAVQRDDQNRPKRDVVMKVKVEELTYKKIEKLYGITYPIAP